MKTQEQPKHFLTEPKHGSMKPVGTGEGWVGGFLGGRCLKKAFTAPVTPSSVSMAAASSSARSFTCNSYSNQIHNASHNKTDIHTDKSDDHQASPVPKKK